MQGIDVGDQVPANAVGIDQLHYTSFFDCLLANVVARQEERVAIEAPTQWRMWNAQIRKNVIVESMLPDEEVMHTREERS